MKQFYWVRDTWGRIRPGAVTASANFSLNPEVKIFASRFILLLFSEALSSGWTLEINLKGCSVVLQRIHFIGQPAGMCCSDECDGQMERFQLERDFAQVRPAEILVFFSCLPMDHLLADLGIPNLISLLQKL